MRHRTSGGATGDLLVLVSLVLLGSCYSGAFYGTGTACTEQSPCRAPLVCVAGRCEQLDGAAEPVPTEDAPAVDEMSNPDTDTMDSMPTDPDDTDAMPDDVAGLFPYTPLVLILATTDNKLWLISAPASSLLDPISNRAAPMDIGDQFGAIGPVDDVEVQAIGQEVNALVRQGMHIFLASVTGPKRIPWRMVGDDVVAMGLANRGNRLWACLVDGAGRLHLATRLDSDEWQDQGPAMIHGDDERASPGTFTKVDCAGIGTNLEIFVLDDGGSLWHMVDGAEGHKPIQRLEGASTFIFQDIDVSSSFGEMHVLGSTTSKQFHASRTTDGQWSAFGDVERIVGDPMGDILAGGMTAVGTEIEWLQVNDRGEIWMSSRARVTPTIFRPLAPYATDLHPFMRIAATSIYQDGR